MTRSLIYIRLAAQQPVTYTVPLLEHVKREVPGITTFEFDNFSEESIRLYAAELLKQSQRAAIVVEAASAGVSISGLTSFFNRLLKAKPPVLLMVLQGEQPLLQKMMQALAGPHFYHNLEKEAMQGLLEKSLS